VSSRLYFFGKLHVWQFLSTKWPLPVPNFIVLIAMRPGSRCIGSRINDVVTPKTTATLLERAAACLCVPIASGSSLARSRLPRVFLPSFASSQTHDEDGVLAPAVVLLRVAGPDDEPQHLSPEGSRCTTCSCSFFLSKPVLATYLNFVQSSGSMLPKEKDLPKEG